MRHPFELKTIEIADIETFEHDEVLKLTDEEAKQISGGGEAELTTLALGEEGGSPGVTTLALGEEGGSPSTVTTLALGEEGGDFNQHYY